MLWISLCLIPCARGNSILRRWMAGQCLRKWNWYSPLTGITHSPNNLLLVGKLAEQNACFFGQCLRAVQVVFRKCLFRLCQKCPDLCRRQLLVTAQCALDSIQPVFSISNELLNVRASLRISVFAAR